MRKQASRWGATRGASGADDHWGKPSGMLVARHIVF